MALIGYARVSTLDQDPDLQHRELKAAGCVRIFTDKASGKNVDRPELAKALDYMRDGDSLVVWRLDRLGRSLQHLVRVVCDLRDKGQHLKVLNGLAVDTSTPDGRLIFHIFCALAEFEADLISERTKAGLASARARGRKGGRRAVLTEEQKKMAIQLYESRQHTAKEIADSLGCSRTTLYRVLETQSAK